MLHKTQGVVFRFTRYGESSIIANIFTSQFGLQSYIVNGIRSKSSKIKIALFQPLTLLDLVVYHRENAGIQRIKEVKCLYPYQQLHLDIRKSTIALFIDEVINKSIREQSHTEDLCDFLIQSFIHLDQQENPENFHLLFLIQLSKHLGFGTQRVNEILGGRLMDGNDERLLDALLHPMEGNGITITRLQRKNILDALLHFYASHVENFGKMKSLPVLIEVLS